VSAHQFESLRSLIINVGMFIDLVNVVERSFEILLLQKELSFYSICPWSFLFVSAPD